MASDAPAYLWMRKLGVGRTSDDVVIHGAARGADTIADGVAKYWDIRVQAYPANWDVIGKRAGVARNEWMLADSKPDQCLAFLVQPHECRGTWDMIRRCIAAKVPVTIVTV